MIIIIQEIILQKKNHFKGACDCNLSSCKIIPQNSTFMILLPVFLFTRQKKKLKVNRRIVLIIFLKMNLNGT